MKRYVFILFVISLISYSTLYSQDSKKIVKITGIPSDSLILDIQQTPLFYLDSTTTKQLELQRKAKMSSTPMMNQTSIQPTVSYYDQYDNTENINIDIIKPSQKTRNGISSAVGEIKMSSDVSHNGTMVIDVPIELPKGTGELIPNISLSYNNQAGNSVAGYGWNISGLSPVTYRTRSLYYDGNATPPQTHFFSDLYWEGKRLVFRGGVMNSQAAYHLENSEGTVTAFRANGRANDLHIYDNQGRTFEYKTINMNGTILLMRVSDRFGNYMDYSYKTDQNVNYIEKISYGGNLNKNTTHHKFVYFYYETRHDPILSFSPYGVKMNTNLRLKTISTEEKTYTINYTNSYFSKLTRIDCILKNGVLTQNLEPLYFTYGMSSGGSMKKLEGTMRSYFTDGKHETIEATTSQLSTYDKEEGVITYPKKDMYKWGKLKGDNYETAHSMYHPDDVVFVAPTYNDALDYFGLYQVKCNNGFRTVLNLDADNLPDTKEAVIINANGGYTGGTQHIQMRVFGYAGLAMYGVIKTLNFYLPSNYSYNNYYSVTQIGYQIGNFKGDGIERIIGVQHNNGGFSLNSIIYMFDVKTGKYSSYRTPFNIGGSDQIIAMDYDNDGKTDLYHFHDNGFDIYSFNPTKPTETTDLAFTMTKVASSIAINRHHFHEESKEKTGNIFSGNWYARRKVLFGDINGDGKLDILMTAKYGTKKGEQRSMKGDTWTQLLSAGSGKFEISTYDMAGIWLNTYRDVFMHDFNGDGRSDVVCIRNGNLQVIHSNGNIIDKNKINLYSLGGLDPEGKLFTIDQNNSNHNRVIGFIRNNKIAKLSIDRNEIASGFLTSVLSSHNVRTNITYSKINDNSTGYGGIYNSGYGAKFPFENYNGYFWVVSNLNQVFNGDGRKTFDRSYYYSNLVMHRQGLGFCGFEKISYHDAIAGKNHSVTYDPYNFSIIKQIDSSDKLVENNYSISLYGNKETRIRLTSQKTTDRITGYITTITNTYDSYGNTTKILTDYGSGIKEEKTVDYYNNIVNNSNKNRVGFPINITNKKTRGSNTYTISNHITYDVNQLPIKTIEKINGNIVSQKELTFDAFSNIIKEDIIPYSATAKKLTTTFIYDTNGSKVLKTINPLGQTMEFIYSSNLLTSTKDHKGGIVKYEYDAAKRIIKQTNADGTTEQTSYAYDTYSYYTITKTASNRPTSIIRYDGLHREVRNQVQSINSNIYTITEYDIKGRVSRKSLPHNNINPVYWSTYSYDNHNRVLQINHASGKKDIYSYDKNTTKLTSEGLTSTQVNDVLGLTISSTDAGGTTTYSYRADGQPDKITAPGNIVTTITYDSFGRQLTIKDPSGGTYQYAYDDAGNINKEINPKGGISTFTYDKYGRVTSKTIDGITTNNTYKNIDGFLISAVSNNGISTYYETDNFGRIIKERNNNNSKWFEMYRSYLNGNISTVSYKSNTSNNSYIAQEFYTYQNGHLKKIELLQSGSTTKKPIWIYETENQIGQPLKITTGNVSRNFTYNNVGTLTGQSVIKGTTYIQNLAYNFDPLTNNLLSRKDTRGLQETFRYDNLNRLISYKEGTITYDSKGNITQNINGIYSYNSQNTPYAIKEATIKTTAIPFREQVMEFNNMNRVKSIKENGFEASFLYNSNGDRTQMILKKNNNIQYSKYYLSPNYEVTEGQGAKEVLYLKGDAYSSDIVLIKENGKWGLHHICRDYLGSITHITNESGTIRNELNYDAWGRRRNPTNLAYYSDGQEPELLIGRGYTGHEHLACFGLINMNARLYEPAMGRFISPDPFIINAFMSQDFNRYSYAKNNPLKFVDKNGEIVWWIPVAIGAVVGAYSGASIQSGTWNFTNWSSDWWKGAIAGAFVGATAGGLVASAVGATGMAAPLTTGSTTVMASTKAWGITSTIIHNAAINIGITAFSGGSWDMAWKYGLAGAVSGAWGVTGGFGAVKNTFGIATGWGGALPGKLIYQAGGTVLNSVGYNIARGENPFYKVTLGIGPVNLTLGKGQKLFRFDNNMGTIIANTLGMSNALFIKGGQVRFDYKNLAFEYSGGSIIDKMGGSGWGPYAMVMGPGFTDVGHESHHIWQARAMAGNGNRVPLFGGDTFLLTYTMNGISGAIYDKTFNFWRALREGNWFEMQAYEGMWWNSQGW